MFPHHENEIAIAGGLKWKTLGPVWDFHCDRVLIDGKKVHEKKTRITLGKLGRNGLIGPGHPDMLFRPLSKAVEISRNRAG